MADLYLMVGIPGSGKSTFIKEHMNKNFVRVSRDEIRFSLLSENDNYFSKEFEVLKIFYKTINKNLAEGKTVVVDQTSLNPEARRKLLNQIKENYNKLFAIYMDTPLETCIKRNNKREGRECVPVYAIKNMYKKLKPPSLNEGFYRIYTYSNGILKYEGVI